MTAKTIQSRYRALSCDTRPAGARGVFPELRQKLRYQSKPECPPKCAIPEASLPAEHKTMCRRRGSRSMSSNPSFHHLQLARSYSPAESDFVTNLSRCRTAPRIRIHIPSWIVGFPWSWVTSGLCTAVRLLMFSLAALTSPGADGRYVGLQSFFLCRVRLGRQLDECM